MESLKRAKSLPAISSSANFALDHLLLQQKHLKYLCVDDEVVPDDWILNPFSSSRSKTAVSATTNAASLHAEKEPSCYHHTDTGRSNYCNFTSFPSQAACVRREEPVSAAEEPGKQSCLLNQVRVSASAAQQQHNLKQRQIFSFLATTAAVTKPGSGMQSESDHVITRKKRMTLASFPSDELSVEPHHQMPEASSSSPTLLPHELAESDFQELYLPETLILKELSEMRQILQKLLEQNKELSLIASPLVADDDILSAVLGFRSITDTASRHSSSSSLMTMDSSLSLNTCTTVAASQRKEPMPGFPVGSYDLVECNICFSIKWLYHRPCCSFPACVECLTEYFSSRIELGLVSIECINSLCRCFVHRDEISLLLPAAKKAIYCTLLANSNSNELSKTCPRCNHILKLESASLLKSMERASRKNPAAAQVTCIQCSYRWCFPCSSPAHEGISCRQYLKGDRLLQDWAKQVSQGQVNAQKCPKCGILIQKSSGCDHMHCPRCKTDFCYRCGDSLRRLKFFGDHYSKLSVFGCKYRYKAAQPIQRKLIRGAVFTSKLMMAPVLGSLALVAGAVVVGVGVAALPLYGGMKLFRRYQQIAINRNQFHISSSLDGPSRVSHHSRDVVSTAAQTVHITFMSDNYVDEIHQQPFH